MDIQNIADEEVNNQDNYTSSPKVSFSYRVSIRSTDGSVKNYSEQTMLSYYKNKDNPNFKSTNYSINLPLRKMQTPLSSSTKQILCRRGMRS